jgi:hypothetical protein
MKQIYIDDLYIHNYEKLSEPIFIKQDIEGLEMPPMRLSSYDRVGENGTYISNQLYSGRRISLEGGIYSPDRATFEQSRRDLIQALKVQKNSLGIPQPHTLFFTTLDDLSLQVPVYLNSFQMKKQKLHYIDFRIELVSSDYNLYSQTQTEIVQQVVQNGGLVVDVGLQIIPPIVAQSSDSESLDLTNNGDSETYPVITLEGPLTYPIITNNTTGQFIALDLILGDEDSAVVDVLKKTIMLNGTTNVLSSFDLTSTWFYLLPGVNNMLLSSRGGNGTVTFTYRDAYLGI